MALSEHFPSIPNETFFSWLHRQSIFSEAFRYPLYMLLDDFERCSRLGPFDRDFDFGSAFAKVALNRLSLHHDDCAALFGTSTWLLPQYNRRAFCWECLQEQIRTVYYPCYLMSWCSVMRTHCSVHSSLLREHLRSDRLSLNLGLGAFMDFCANKGQYERDELHKLFSSKPIAGYCLRMASQMEIEKLAHKADSVSTRKIYKLLMQIMLFPSYGIINTILQRKRQVQRTSNVWQSLAYAPICSSNIDRALALLLVGIASRFFSRSEAFEIIDILAGSRYLDVRFHDQKTLGSACNVFDYDTANQIFRAIDCLCLGRTGANIEEFLAGFMGRSRRR